MDIAKVTNLQEFRKVLDAYIPMATDPKAIVSTKNELKSKLEFFINKQIVKLNKESFKDASKLQDLLDLLIILDKDLPYEDFFSKHGLEWFNVIFKLTFYSNKNAVINSKAEQGYLKLNILPPSEVEA